MSAVAVVIPALDEEASIGALIGEMPRDIVRAVIVVDNGSTDATAARARAAGAIVVAEPQRGYGRAVAAGIRSVPEWAEIVVFLDGDGSDNPTSIAALVAPIESGVADFVLGTRTCGTRDAGSLSLLQIAAGRFAGLCLRILYGVKFTDMSPFRAVRKRSLDKLAMTEMTYGWNLQMMMLVARDGLRIREIPVHSRTRSGGVSKVSGNWQVVAIAGFRILSVLARTALPLRQPRTARTLEKVQ